jgi:outer membrane immunogenic protein
MKKIIVAAAFAVLGATAIASAADLPMKARPAPLPPPPSWTGFYVGINGGWIGSADNTITNTGTDTGTGGLGTGLINGAIPPTVNLRTDGGLVGGTFGYNWQVNPMWVIGLEGDIDWVGNRKTFDTGFITTSPFVPTETIYERRLNWLGTFRGRVGITPSGPFLLYVTGGLAVGESRIASTLNGPTFGPPTFTEPSTSLATTRTRVGWTAGAGAEWMFAPSWSFKAEYLFVDLGTVRNTIAYTYGGNTSTMTSSVRETDHVARVGVNYHFSGPIVARY